MALTLKDFKAMGIREQLARTIMAEAGNQPYEGQVAVGQVVKNRVDSGRWGKNYSDVLLAPRQFSAYNKLTDNNEFGGGADLWMGTPSEMHYKAADAVLAVSGDCDCAAGCQALGHFVWRFRRWARCCVAVRHLGQHGNDNRRRLVD